MLNTTMNMKDGELYAALEGRLDTLSSPGFEKEMEAYFGELTALTLDFEKLEYISSAGLRTILSVQQYMEENGYRDVKVMDKAQKEVYGMLYCQNGKKCVDFCDVLLADLVTQIDLETEYRKYRKDGPCTLVTFQHRKTASEEASKPYSVPPIKKVCFLQSPMGKPEIEDLIIKRNLDDSPNVVRIYNSPDDFVVGGRPAKIKRSKARSR